jgi:hypothetical protein
MTATLFRPVGLHELALIWDSGMREFPPRLPHQPIFDPVTNTEYARQIAKDWNARDEKSGFAGFVTEFAVGSEYIAQFAPHVVGASQIAPSGVSHMFRSNGIDCGRPVRCRVFISIVFRTPARNTPRLPLLHATSRRSFRENAACYKRKTLRTSCSSVR